MMKRNLLAVLISITLLAVLVAIAAVPILFSQHTIHASSGYYKYRPATTITALMHISVVGSTAFIVDGQGHTIATDPNPYGVAIVPTSARMTAGSTLKPGDIVVTNIGNNDTGTTLVRFPNKMGPGRLFNTTPNANTMGPADEAFNTLTGTDWVANIHSNAIQVFTPNGTVLLTLKSALFNKPWGQSFNNGVHNRQDGSVGSFFVSNVANATIDRIDIIPSNNGTTFRVFQIGQLKMAGKETKIGLTWLPSLQMGGKLLSDVLLAIDPANNRIAAYPNSSTSNTSTRLTTSNGLTVFQGKPLNMPGGLVINPLNGDLLVVNLNDNNLVELNMMTGRVIGTKLLDNVPDDLQTGNGSALFGVAATRDARGNLVVYFTDDNTNTLDMLSV